MGEKNWEEKEKDKNRIILAIVQYTSRWYSSYRIYISLDITLTVIFDHLSPCKSWKYITLEYLDDLTTRRKRRLTPEREYLIFLSLIAII